MSDGIFLSDIELISFNYEKKCEPLDFDYPVFGHASVASSEGVITCGGRSPKNSPNWMFPKIYDTLSKCILQTSKGQIFFPSMVTTRYSYGMINVEGIIYAIGGYPGEDTMETINIETGVQWKKESLPFNALTHCLVNINTTLISVGGSDQQADRIIYDGRVS